MSVHITNQIIKKGWTDYNNHMNMAYYVLVFDQAWEEILQKFQMGENSAKTTNMSTMVVETHTTYNAEVKEGDEVEIILSFFVFHIPKQLDGAKYLRLGDTYLPERIREA